jgi:branched-chain amino acid aminotransferase
LIKKGKGNSLYITFMIATGEGVIANPSNDYKFIIISCKIVLFWGSKKSAEHFSRAANGGIELLKPQVIMLQQFYPTSLANAAGFQQVIGLMMQHIQNWKKLVQ